MQTELLGLPADFDRAAADAHAMAAQARSIMRVHTATESGLGCSGCFAYGRLAPSPCPSAIWAGQVLKVAPTAVARAVTNVAAFQPSALAPHPHRGVAQVPTFTGGRSAEEIPEGPVAVPEVEITADDGSKHHAIPGESEVEDLRNQMVAGSWWWETAEVPTAA